MLFYQSPGASVTMLLGEGWAERVARELKEQVREGWRGPHHVGAFFIREALLQVKREGLEQNRN